MKYTIERDYDRSCVRPCPIKDRKSYFDDIITLEEIMFEQQKTYPLNDFLHEWAQLLINAMYVFEAGYYDCAYYSLRQALEMAVLILYFVDIPEINAQEKWQKWMEQQDFPTINQMLNELKQNGEKYQEMHKVFPEFSSELRVLQKILNKLVHKQGFFYLYTIHGNSMLILNKDQNHFIIRFPEYLTQTIRLIAMIRVFIDPYPLLLADKDIAKKSFCLTTPYPKDFINKYLGYDFVDKYKTTNLYQKYYNECINEQVVRVV